MFFRRFKCVSFLLLFYMLVTFSHLVVYNVVAFFRAVFDRAKMIAETIKRRLKEANSPAYCRVAARTTPLIIGPNVCPTSIMVLRKPIDAPIKLDGTISLISGDVEEITIAKPMPYPMESSSNIGNCTVNGTASNIKQLTIDPVIIGMRLLVLSDILPINGLAIMNATIWLPIMIPIENASNLATSVR
jgi:hypothetical protein